VFCVGKVQSSIIPLITREKLIQAYEFALDHIGLDPCSGGIWLEYCSFVKSGWVFIITSYHSLMIALYSERFKALMQRHKRWLQLERSSRYIYYHVPVTRFCLL